MQINCQKCGSPITAENINLDRMVAKCSECHSVFSIANMIESPVPPPSARVEPSRIDVPMPKGFQVDNREIALTITRKWFGPVFIFLTIFAIIWNGFILFWMGMAIASGFSAMALFGTLHAAVGIGLAYYVAAGFLNSTVVEVDGSRLSVKHGPLPFPGNRLLDITQIKQLYSKEVTRRSRNSTRTSYEVHAITHDGQHEKLLTNLRESEQALYLEQEIERFLSIADRPVRGEMAR